jgi:hypothetical protein
MRGLARQPNMTEFMNDQALPGISHKEPKKNCGPRQAGLKAFHWKSHLERHYGRYVVFLKWRMS